MITFEEFKQFFDANKAKDEVKALVGQPAEMTAESVQAFLDSDKGRPVVDRYVNRAILSHDEKRAPEIQKQIDEAREAGKAEGAKAGTMSAEERLTAKIAEMEKSIKDRDAAIARKDRDEKIRAIAAEKKAPSWLTDAVIENPSATIETATARFDAFAKAHKEEIEAEVNQRLSTNGHKPGGGRSPDDGGDKSMAGLSDEIKAALNDPSLDRFK